MKLFYVFLSALLSFISASAHATGVDVSSLSGSVDMSTVITAILAVAATMVGVHVAWKAAKLVIAAVRGL